MMHKVSKTSEAIRTARSQRMALLQEARSRWQLSHSAARGEDETFGDYRARQNQLKRLRKLQPHIVWASNVARASADTRRNRRKIHDEQAAQRKARGRNASLTERTISILVKARVLILDRRLHGWCAIKVATGAVGRDVTRHGAFRALIEQGATK